MGNINICCACFFYGSIELLPVSMIRHDKAPVSTFASARTTKLHPATANTQLEGFNFLIQGVPAADGGAMIIAPFISFLSVSGVMRSVGFNGPMACS